MRTATRVSLAIAVLFTFALVSRAADTAKDLEATPQGKAYRAQIKAIQTGDYEAYKKSMVAAAGKDMDKQLKDMNKTGKEAMEMMKAMLPSDLKLTDLKVDGKKATMMATGKMDKEVNKGTIQLEEENGQWKVGKQSWTNAK
jgi:hypothetical protein